MIRVGLVGCGYWGEKLLRVLRGSARCEVRWVADRDPERLARAQTRCPLASVTTDAHELLEARALDAVVIATPAELHGGQALEALRRGRHLLIEKPMTTDVGEAEEIVALARARQLVVVVDHTFLFTSAVDELRDRLAAGELGAPAFVRAERFNRGSARHTTHALWDLGAHDVALLDALFPGELDRARTSTSGSARSAQLVLETPGGLRLEVACGYRAPARVRTMELVGSGGRLVYDGSTPAGSVEPTVGTNNRNPLEPLGAVVEHFLDQVVSRGLKPSVADGACGLRVVRVLGRALRPLPGARSARAPRGTPTPRA